MLETRYNGFKMMGNMICNPPSGHIPRQNIIHKDTFTPLFIVALITIAKTWIQPKCPLTGEWIKMCYI